MSATDLSARKCVPCSGGTPPLAPDRVTELLADLPGWSVTPAGKHITRTWTVVDFVTGLDFFRRIGEVAESENHHPDLHLVDYRVVTVQLTTHEAGGLTENDFILAAKINALDQPRLKGSKS